MPFYSHQYGNLGCYTHNVSIVVLQVLFSNLLRILNWTLYSIIRIDSSHCISLWLVCFYLLNQSIWFSAIINPEIDLKTAKEPNVLNNAFIQYAIWLLDNSLVQFLNLKPNASTQMVKFFNVLYCYLITLTDGTNCYAWSTEEVVRA